MFRTQIKQADADLTGNSAEGMLLRPESRSHGMARMISKHLVLAMLLCEISDVHQALQVQSTHSASQVGLADGDGTDGWHVLAGTLSVTARDGHKLNATFSNQILPLPRRRVSFFIDTGVHLPGFDRTLSATFLGKPLAVTIEEALHSSPLPAPYVLRLLQLTWALDGRPVQQGASECLGSDGTVRACWTGLPGGMLHTTAADTPASQPLGGEHVGDDVAGAHASSSVSSSSSVPDSDCCAGLLNKETRPPD